MPHGKRLHQKLHQAGFAANLPGFIPGNQMTVEWQDTAMV